MSLGSPHWKVVYFLATFHLADDVEHQLLCSGPSTSRADK